MATYHKINTMFKRDMDGNKKLIEGEWADPVLEYLKDNDWTFTEKVDGTNIRVYWLPWGEGDPIEVTPPAVRFGGRTNNALIPAKLVEHLQHTFTTEKLADTFPRTPVVLYGEGHGAGIQKGGDNYSATQQFVLFDVWVGRIYLQRHNVEDIATRLGIPVVPVIGHGSLNDAIKMVKIGIGSAWGDFEAEGVVARPTVELLDRRGFRIITKIKAKDFT